MVVGVEPKKIIVILCIIIINNNRVGIEFVCVIRVCFVISDDLFEDLNVNLYKNNNLN